MKELDILHEVGPYWITKTKHGFEIYKNGLTHSTGIGEAYPDLSVAIARANYLARKVAANA